MAHTEQLAQLLKNLVEHFDLEELRTLCFDLGVNYDDLGGEGITAKARGLITVMLRQNRLAELASKLRVQRPDVDWPDVEAISPEERLAWTTATEMQSAADYVAAVRDYCASLPYLSLHDIRPPKTLDEVYVPLKARPQPRKEKQDLRGLGDLERHGPLSISDVMRKRDPPHVLILGEPGAGKSTLLRQLAEHAWDAPDKLGLDAPRLPILVPLRRLASAEGALEDRLNHALAAELTLTEALPQGFFTNWPKQTGANWLILLDALDEVPAEQRAQLMQWLKGLLSRIGQNRVVLTSRPSGYTQDELDEKLFGHYDLLSFTPDQTDEFAHKWFEDEAEQFLKELERVRAGALSGTPLLLTIAAKVYLEKGTLPERRSGLYGQFVDIWLNEAEQRGLRAELGDPVCDVARFALARLALAMTKQPTQTEASLGKVAADYLRKAVRLTLERAEIAGERFLEVMARRSGVFTRRGDTYGFVHPTFREHLAATAIVREFGAEPEQIWERAVSHWAQDNWRAVALFVLSLLNDQNQDIADVTVFVERIDLTIGLHFVADVLAERIRVEDRLSNAVIDELIAIARRVSGWYVAIEPNAVTLLGRLGDYPRAVKGLLVLARDENKTVDERVREQSTEALGQLGQADDLLVLARDEKVSGGVRERAAEALSRLGHTDEAIPVLLALACDRELDEWVREHAAEALSELERADEAAQAWLTLSLDERTDARVCWSAAVALSKFGRINDLLVLACNEKMNELVRMRVAVALGQLGRADEAASILLALARDEKVDASVRERVAEAMVELGQVDEATHAWLVLASDDGVDTMERKRATEELGQFADPRALPALEQIAQEDESQEVRQAAQRAIKQIRQRT